MIESTEVLTVGSGYLYDSPGNRVTAARRGGAAIRPREMTLTRYDIDLPSMSQPSTPRIVSEDPSTLAGVLPSDTLELGLLVDPTRSVRVVALDGYGQMLGELFPWPFGQDTILLPLAQTAKVKAVPVVVWKWRWDARVSVGSIRIRRGTSRYMLNQIMS